jgi:hypothetical protein
MKKPLLPLMASFVAAAVLLQPVFAQDNAPLSPQTAEAVSPRAFVPMVIKGQINACSTNSTAQYNLIGVQGPYYKDNRLTDENADFRLSILGYSSTPVSSAAPLALVEYGNPPDLDGLKLHGIFSPNRIPKFVKNYQRFDWKWNENGPPPYGTRGRVNNDYPVAVLDMGTTAGEQINIPEISANNNPIGTKAMVLYADERQITLVYGDRDRVDSGFVIYLANFCVDPNLVALYRAQLENGKRATGRLPALFADQKIGVANGAFVTVAIRDQGAFLDPRSRTDWWAGISQ